MRVNLRQFYKSVLLLLLFAIGMVLAAGLFPLLDVALVSRKAKYCQDRIKLRWLQVFGWILGLKTEVTGSAVSEPVFLVGNHVSWIDIIVLGQLLPGCFVAKNDISSWPVIGFLSAKAGAIFIRRGDKRQILQTVERMAWQFQQQGNVLAFPEGTTTTGDRVLEFHSSLFHPAMLSRTAIQPVAILYGATVRTMAPFVGDDDFLPHLWRMLKLKEIPVSVHFLPVIDGAGRHRNDVSAEARRLIFEAVVLERQAMVA